MRNDSRNGIVRENSLQPAAPPQSAPHIPRKWLPLGSITGRWEIPERAERQGLVLPRRGELKKHRGGTET
jgi:hypothetical protein